MSEITLIISKEMAQYLRRKFHQAAKDLRRRRRDTVYSGLSGEDLQDFYMLEGMAAYMEWSQQGMTTNVDATFTERQIKYLQGREPRLYKFLMEGCQRGNGFAC